MCVGCDWLIAQFFLSCPGQLMCMDVLCVRIWVLDLGTNGELDMVLGSTLRILLEQ